MRQVTTNVYQYAELDDKAKERARDWFRQRDDDDGDMFWAESPTENFQELLKACGWYVDSKRGLQWSGFSSQGDGAAFSGSWSAARCNPAAWLAERPASYIDATGKVQACVHNKRYHEAVGEIVALAAKYPTGYGHVDHGRSNFIQVGSFYIADSEGEETEDTDGLAEELADAARSLAHAFYWNLSGEYDYQNSDEQVAEAIEANEYEFTENGEIA